MSFGPCRGRVIGGESGFAIAPGNTMTTARPLLLSLAIAATLTGALAMPSPVSAQEAATAAVAASDKAARLDALYEQYREELLKLHPPQATFQGDNRSHDHRPQS